MKGLTTLSAVILATFAVAGPVERADTEVNHQLEDKWIVMSKANTDGYTDIRPDVSNTAEHQLEKRTVRR
jgi:hypothetical protein